MAGRRLFRTVLHRTRSTYLATTTDSTGATHAVTTRSVGTDTVDTRAAMLVLMSVVFIGGATVMTVEMSASRLLAPYFGTSLFIWAILIGLVMIYLTVGYWVGGRLADRMPRASVLYGITGVAGFAVGLVPVLSGPILRWSLEGFANLSL